MSNRIVPVVYRKVIDNVLGAVAADFDEYGVDEDILKALQAKWESKLLETRVAPFHTAGNASREDDDLHQPSSPTNSLNTASQSHASSSQYTNQLPSQYRPFASPSRGLAIPTLPQQLLNQTNGGYPAGPSGVKAEQDEPLRIRGGAVLDSPEIKPVISTDLLRNSQDVRPQPNEQGLLPGDEIINSDLDDSDDDELRNEGEDGFEGGDADIVFCVWDKVQRVKNKWKTTFKDGMIHINGRDYLFAKCTGELEW